MSNTKFVCIHGHFYQPPRENAWMEAIELQEGAAPFHDWNDRINFECYARNATARLLGEDGFIRKIVNNYASISFNFGPTLLSWLEKNDPGTYQKIVDADTESRARFGGHGNAIAQVYNHLIMPLANARDQETQVRWGIADFEHRFGRRPEGMWLAETAADTPTLEALVAHGIRFTILAPRQAKAFRHIGSEKWTPLDGSVDPRRPYRCFLPSGKFIDLFFYDGNVAEEVAFKRILDDGTGFARRLAGLVDSGGSGPQLAHIATDGESYGHHHRFGEMALASAIESLEKNDHITLTNYGEFLEKHPPVHEVQIHEPSSWSCVHGVERWRSDCGCHTGGQDGWNQAWRAPLRDTLDWLRREMDALFEKLGGEMMADPWAARNDYISLVLARSREGSDAFTARHAKRKLDEYERTTFLRLLEMQRHAMLMYTSCAWFFNEISGIETDQVLQYALRAMQYARYVKGPDFRAEFEQRLAQAPSNLYKDGAESYRQNVIPSQMSLVRVGMHYAATVLFEDADTSHFLDYTVQNEVFERIPAGFQRLALGRTTIISHRTFSKKSFSFIALYLGQQNILGSVKLEMPREEFDRLRAEAGAAFRRSNLGDVILLLQSFGDHDFSFNDLLKDEKRRILQTVMARNLPPVEAVVGKYYDDNYHLMNGIQQGHVPLPEGWAGITSFVLNRRLGELFENGKLSVGKLQALAGEFKRWEVEISALETLNLVVGERILAELKKINEKPDGHEKLLSLSDVLKTVGQLGIKPELWKSQDLYFEISKKLHGGRRPAPNESWRTAFQQLGDLLNMRPGPA